MTTERLLQHLKNYPLLWVDSYDKPLAVYNGKDGWMWFEVVNGWAMLTPFAQNDCVHPITYEQFKEAVC